MFNARLKLLLLFCCLSVGVFSNAHAKSDRATLDVNSSTREYVELEKEVMKTLYRKEPYQTTCYRRETYSERECGNVTKYRRECSTIPGRNQCYTDYERQCRTTYQRECTTQYERQCRTEPGRVDCRRAPNGEQVCQKIPPRELCESVPRQYCRDVPRQECTNVPRERCEWIPPQQQCQDIPYQEYECKNVEKYRDIPYACTEYRDVPYEVRDQLVIGKINFDSVLLPTSDLSYRANLSISNSKAINVAISNVNTAKSVILRARKSERSGVNGDVKTIEANYTVIEERPTQNSVLNGVKVSWVGLERNKITIAIGKEIDFSKLTVEIQITKDGSVYLDRELPASAFAVSKRNGMTYIGAGITNNGGSELGGVLNKTYKVNVVLRQRYQIENPESVIFENVSKNLTQEVKFATSVKRD